MVHLNHRTVVQDPDLIHRIEAVNQRPEADQDQKIEITEEKREDQRAQNAILQATIS